MTERLLQTAVAVAAVAIAWQLPPRSGMDAGRDAAGPNSAAASDPDRERAGGLGLSDPAPMRPIPDSAVFHGLAVQLYTGENCWERFGRLMPEIAALGADTVLLVVHAYQDHAGSMNLRRHGTKTPTDADVGRIIDHAHRCGLRVILMPIVLLEYPRGSEWRGRIKPPDLDGWFRRYTEFILAFARVAEKHDVELYMIGSELVGLESSTDRWRRLVGEVKQFYRGKLGYSANWDHYRPVQFWDLLDVAALTSYYQLSNHPGPTVDEVAKAWEPFKKDILEFQREIRKPIMFTEVGWCSQEGAAVEAWNYYHKQEATAAGLQEQAVLYEAFMQVWGDEPTVGGFLWWEWTPDAGGPDDYNYTPRGKPAEKLLREWFSRKAARHAPASRPAAADRQAVPDAAAVGEADSGRRNFDR